VEDGTYRDPLQIQEGFVYQGARRRIFPCLRVRRIEIRFDYKSTIRYLPFGEPRV
jgi:hypothetical protein